MDVSLFITCLSDNFYPRAGIAVVKVLEHLGCTIDFPQGQTCCGQPMWNTGFHHDARELARRMIQVFEHSPYVVSPSGSCVAMVREYYPAMFENDHAWHHDAQALAGRTYEFVEFLIKVLKVDLHELGVKWPGKVTYHYSCHLRGIHVPGGGQQIADFMGRIDGLELVPLEKSEQCCGFGGTFATKFPEISGAMVRDKVGCIAATGAPTVVSNDAGCTMNISGACRREGVSVRFKTLAEIIAEGLGLLEREDGQ